MYMKWTIKKEFYFGLQIFICGGINNKDKNFRKFESFQVGFLENNKPEMGRAIITIANILNIVIQNSKNKTIICQ